MCAEATRIGVLGGTFDPVHLGHLASAREVAAAYSLDRVLLVLAARPPHKRTDEAAPAELRWRMLRLAVEQAGEEQAAQSTVLEACDVELRRSGPSFTVDTLHELQGLHPDAELFLILGIDAYEEIDTWSRPADILDLASIVVTTRPGREFPGDALLPPVAARRDARYDPAIGAHVHTSGHIVSSHRIRGLEISATDIRNRVRAGLPIAHLTGDAVARFITEHRLYGSGDAASCDQPAADPAPPRSNGEPRHCKN